MGDVGLKDIFGEEIVYDFQLLEGAANSRLAVIMRPDGGLRLMKLNHIAVVAGKTTGAIFTGKRYGGFGFKGGGKKYGYTGPQALEPYYKFDYVGPDLYVRQVHHLRSYNGSNSYTYSRKIFGPVLFMTSLWIFAIKRQQKKQRELFKSNLLNKS